MMQLTVRYESPACHGEGNDVIIHWAVWQADGLHPQIVTGDPIDGVHVSVHLQQRYIILHVICTTKTQRQHLVSLDQHHRH